MTPTVPPSPAQGETAGVSEEQLAEARRYADHADEAAMIPSRMVKRAFTHIDALRQQLAEMRAKYVEAILNVDGYKGLLSMAQRKLTEMSEVISGRLRDRLLRDLAQAGCAGTAQLLLDALAVPDALAPTSQPSRGDRAFSVDSGKTWKDAGGEPSRGKCETCDGTGFVPCIVGTHTTAAGVGEKECERCGGTGKVQDVVDSVDPEWSQGVEYPCPDCAQPERQGADKK